MSDTQITQLVDTVLKSAKYKNICPDFVRTIGAQELTKRRNLKEAVKATKNKLHQVGGAYLPGKMNYTAWLAELNIASQAANQDEWGKVCARVLNYHSSTRERLPLLTQFYATILADLPPIHSVIDLACGLNPLAIPWMSLAADVEYYAYDIYQDMIDFLNGFMRLARINGRAEARDVINACPEHSVDLAFVLKAIPCLEQIDKTAGMRLLDTLNANYLVVSFPVHSLGGQQKGMATNYGARFGNLVANKNWPVKRFEFAYELAFLVTKQ
jgi:16S rRNA (guanine(1405)-N(7))-methyltransferase